MMPDGATMEKVCNLLAVREYIKANGKMLYYYANNVRGRDVKNGGLHVVIGHVKSTSWGIATFRNTSKQSNFHLEFLSLHEPGDVANAMSWRHAIRCGTADVKVGPDCRENQDLQGLTEQGGKLCNQALSVITLSFQLRDSAWKKIHAKESVKIHGKGGVQINPSSSVPSPPDTPPESAQPPTATLNFAPSQNQPTEESDFSDDHSQDMELEDSVDIEQPSFTSVCFLPTHTFGCILITCRSPQSMRC